MAASDFGLDQKYTEEDLSNVVEVETLPWDGQPASNHPDVKPSSSPVLLPVSTAFGSFVRDLLSNEECKMLCDLGTSLGMTPASRTPKYRNCDRAFFKSEKLARLLWERIRSLVPEKVEDAAAFQVSDSNVGLEGVWLSHSLNPMFRIVKYERGGHFSPHYDGEYVTSEDMRSFITCNIYLNGDFEGGTTDILSKSAELGGAGEGPVLSTAVVASVTPDTGAALLFSHHILHQGSALGEGNPKWLLRTEVFYERVAGSGPVRTPAQTKAFGLLEEAKRAEENGQYDEACKKYKAAFRLWPQLETLV